MTFQRNELVFLKLGGSLITDKEQPRTPRPEVITRLACEIMAVRKSNPQMKLLLGHGSGSFGHIPAKKYQTRRGVKNNREWYGFVEVWKEAADLNQVVMAILHETGLPAIALPASSSLTADHGRVLSWDLTPIDSALQVGLLPVVYGDVVFDRSLGGTIFSTEDLFKHISEHIKPDLILLTGIESGVWADFPARTTLVEKITPNNIDAFRGALGGSTGTDVTGGMAGKVNEMLELVEKIPGLKVRIFSGEKPGSVKDALFGKPIGTLITTD